MRKKRQKYYVVWKGEQTGVFQNWNDCQESIHKFKGARFKSFDSIDPIREYLGLRHKKDHGRKGPCKMTTAGI